MPITTQFSYNVSGRVHGLMPHVAVGIGIDNYALPAYVQGERIGGTSAIAMLAMMHSILENSAADSPLTCRWGWEPI